MGKVIDKNDFWFIEKNPITKVGVYPYLGKQISQDCEPNKIYYVLRPKEELFRKETLDSLRLIPLIDGHTMIGKDFTAPETKGIDGTLGDNVSHDTDTIYNDLKIISNKMKEEIQNGKKELSLGYFCRYDKQPGTYKGQRYDYVQRDIIANHLALVDKGRMGADVRVYDSKDIENKTYCCDSLDIVFDREFKESDVNRDNKGRFAEKNSNKQIKEKHKSGLNNQKVKRFRELLNKKDTETIEKEFGKKIYSDNAIEQLKSSLWLKYDKGSEDPNLPDFYYLKDNEEEKNKDTKENVKKNTSVDDVIKAAKNREEKKAYIADVSNELMKDAKEHGYDLTGYTHNIDSSAVNHIFNHHGNEEKESKQGQVAVTEEDIKTLPKKIIDNYDFIAFGGKNDRNQDVIAYGKNMDDGSFVYAEEVRTGRKTLTTQTLFKRKTGITSNSFTNIVKSRAVWSNNTGTISIVDKTKKVKKNNAQDSAEVKNKMEYKTIQGEGKMEKEKKVAIDEDKRKLIDEIGGILKGKVDEELWKTIIGKAEKLAYNGSETGKGTDEGEEVEEKEKEVIEEGKEKKAAKDKCGKDEEKDEEAKKKEIVKEFAKKEKLAKEVEDALGTFDHSEMTELEVAKYACDKLELGATEGQELATLKGYLKGIAKAPKATYGYKKVAQDSGITEDEEFEKFTKGE